MISNLDKSQFVVRGEKGLPESYPIPTSVENLLFYIQRNLNKNTVVYTANFSYGNKLDSEYPINVYWIKYSEDGKEAKLNLIQKKAFGYKSLKINDDTYEIIMSSYDKFRLFLHRGDDGLCTLNTKISGQDAILSNIYVFADELGIFPQVKFIEFYGQHIQNQLPLYQRITIS